MKFPLLSSLHKKRKPEEPRGATSHFPIVLSPCPHLIRKVTLKQPIHFLLFVPTFFSPSLSFETNPSAEPAGTLGLLYGMKFSLVLELKIKTIESF
jgi:hypothetical protein